MVDLGTLARYQFEGRSEQAVREEWIAPLLVRLGYGIATLNEIRYEEVVSLAKPFRRIGRERVNVDYVPTVLGHGLWIVEAKAHGKDDWEEAIYQGWLYATHPEIDVPFMVIADGARIAVYDVYRLEWDAPVVDIATSELASRFGELASVVGAANVTRAIRERRMRHLGTAMKAELSYARVAEYVSDIQRLVLAAQAAVGEKERTILHDQLVKEDVAQKESVRTIGLFAIGVWMNQPLAVSLQTVDMGVEYVRTLPVDKRTAELHRLIEAATLGRDSHPRMFWMLRIAALEIYLSLRDDEDCGEQAVRLARAAIRDHILNFPDDPLGRATHRLERVLPVFILRSFLTPEGVDLAQVARNVQQDWGDEARLRARLDGDRFLVTVTTELCITLWKNVPWNADALNQLAGVLEQMLPKLEYRQDGARGPAGDPFLEFYRRVDDLQSFTLALVGRHFSVDLIDEDIQAAVAVMAETDYDFDDRFLSGPARALLARISESE